MRKGVITSISNIMDLCRIYLRQECRKMDAAKVIDKLTYWDFKTPDSLRVSVLRI
jgi:hypothetical protein